MFRKQHFWIYGLVVLAALVLLGLPERAASHLKLAISGMFLPLFDISQSGKRVRDNAADLVVPKADLIKENQKLRQEVQELRLQNMQSQEVWRENQVLRAELGWQKQSPWKGRLAQTIGRDPSNWWRSIHVNLGEKDGVRVNYPVMTSEGLVGRVAAVGLKSSQVVLLGDPKCRVPALVPDAKDSGIIMASGAASWRNTFVDLGYLSRNADLKPGQVVLTSGKGGGYPAGIPIGRVVDTRSIDGLYVEARVKLAANFSSLEKVWILMP